MPQAPDQVTILRPDQKEHHNMPQKIEMNDDFFLSRLADKHLELPRWHPLFDKEQGWPKDNTPEPVVVSVETETSMNGTQAPPQIQKPAPPEPPKLPATVTVDSDLMKDNTGTPQNTNSNVTTVAETDEKSTNGTLLSQKPEASPNGPQPVPSKSNAPVNAGSKAKTENQTAPEDGSIPSKMEIDDGNSRPIVAKPEPEKSNSESSESSSSNQSSASDSSSSNQSDKSAKAGEKNIKPIAGDNQLSMVHDHNISKPRMLKQLHDRINNLKLRMSQMTSTNTMIARNRFRTLQFEVQEATRKINSLKDQAEVDLTGGGEADSGNKNETK